MAPGASFKGKYSKLPTPVSPGPAAYGSCSCGGPCCDYCDKYKGASFGTRHARHVEPPHPGPGAYHVACGTLGAAAAGCSGEDHGHGHMHGTYHSPARSDHNYHYTYQSDRRRA